MSWREILRDYFSFSKKDRLALVLLAGLVIFLALAPRILPDQAAGAISQVDTSWLIAMKQLEKKEDSGAKARSPYRHSYAEEDNSFDPLNSVPQKSRLFVFDPNSLDEKGWKELGLKDKTIATIQNYLAKGGRFYKPTDLARIYGLLPDEYKRLQPFIRIENKADDLRHRVPQEHLPYRRSVKVAILDINDADTSAFISLPGIGSKLANRIVNFRDKLGGFYSVEQVAETYGLPDSTYRKIQPLLSVLNPELRKININTATIDELKVHPYIRFNLARILVAYRDQHGLFEKPEDIQKIMAITPETCNKLLPYLTTGGE